MIGIEGIHVPFNVDMGAEVTVLSEVTWKSFKHSLPLKKTEMSLFGPDQSCLKVLGETTITLSCQGRSSTQHVFIVNNLKNNLRTPSNKALQLLSYVHSVDNSSVNLCYLKPLNESVLRKVHPMPKVDITLVQLLGATIFSKFDANQMSKFSSLSKTRHS